MFITAKFLHRLPGEFLKVSLIEKARRLLPSALVQRTSISSTSMHSSACQRGWLSFQRQGSWASRRQPLSFNHCSRAGRECWERGVSALGRGKAGQSRDLSGYGTAESIPEVAERSESSAWAELKSDRCYLARVEILIPYFQLSVRQDENRAR